MVFDLVAFFQELPKRYAEIGCLMPSSRFLAKAMVEAIVEHPEPRRILEVGPGTGVITRQILKVMGGQDQLWLCEINERFLNRLKESLTHNQHFQRRTSQVRFVHAAVQNLRQEENRGQFDIIISSLPFTNFRPEVVEEIIAVFRFLLKRGGRVTFFEYIGVRKAFALVASPETRDRLLRVDALLREWKKSVHQSGKLRTKVSLLNFPPAVAVQLRS